MHVKAPIIQVVHQQGVYKFANMTFTQITTEIEVLGANIPTHMQKQGFSNNLLPWFD
jgi:hypothetical protein